MNNETKDYSLLRPFNLEAAKQGELLTWHDRLGNGPYTYIYGPDSDGMLCIKYKDVCYLNRSSDLRMAPLCWIENKPVYPGDVLYWNDLTAYAGTKFTIGNKILPQGIIVGESAFADGDVYEDDGKSGVYPERLTWTPPENQENLLGKFV